MVRNISGITGRVLGPAAMAVVWGTACVAGLSYLARHSATAGAAAPAADWPVRSTLLRAPGADTLVIVFHPKCPCSRATASNLAVLLAHCPPGRVHTVAMFVRPTGVPMGWERTDLWDSVAAIPGVTVVADEGGIEAARFGAATSGQALLFDANGRLRFRGGITPGRGHAGDSGGADAVLAVARGDGPAAGQAESQTPVFGCELIDPTTARAEATACHR